MNFEPKVDIFEDTHSYVVFLDMPGAAEEDINIDYEKNTLTVSAKAKPITLEGFSPRYQEFRQGEYRRSFSVSDGINIDSTKATLKDGVLRLELVKSEQEKPKRIAVRGVA